MRRKQRNVQVLIDLLLLAGGWTHHQRHHRFVAARTPAASAEQGRHLLHRGRRAGLAHSPWGRHGGHLGRTGQRSRLGCEWLVGRVGEVIEQPRERAGLGRRGRLYSRGRRHLCRGPARVAVAAPDSERRDVRKPGGSRLGHFCFGLFEGSPQSVVQPLPPLGSTEEQLTGGRVLLVCQQRKREGGLLMHRWARGCRFAGQRDEPVYGGLPGPPVAEA